MQVLVLYVCVSELLITSACMLYICFLFFSAARGSSEEGDPQESLQVNLQN